MDAEAAAEGGFGGGMAVAIDDEDVGLDAVEFVEEIEFAGAGIDEGAFDGAEGLEEVLSLFLAVDGRAALEGGDVLVGAEADVDMAVSGGFFEETDVAAV